MEKEADIKTEQSKEKIFVFYLRTKKKKTRKRENTTCNEWRNYKIKNEDSTIIFNNKYK